MAQSYRPYLRAIKEQDTHHALQSVSVVNTGAHRRKLIMEARRELEEHSSCTSGDGGSGGSISIPASSPILSLFWAPATENASWRFAANGPITVGPLATFLAEPQLSKVHTLSLSGTSITNVSILSGKVVPQLSQLSLNNAAQLITADLTGLSSLSAGLNLNNNTTLRLISADNLKSVGTLNTISSPQLKSVLLPSLTGVTGTFDISNCLVLSAINLSNLKSISGNANFQSNALGFLTLPEITTIGGVLVASSGVLSAVRLPKLKSVGAGINCNDATACQILSAPLLNNISGYFLAAAAGFKSLELPALTSIGSSFILDSAAALTHLDFPLLEVADSFSTQACSLLRTLKVPQLEHAVSFQLNNTGLSAVHFPALQDIWLGLDLASCTNLKTVTAPILSGTGGTISFYGNTTLTAFSLPELTTFYNGVDTRGELACGNCDALSNVSLNLVYECKRIDFSNCTSLAEVSFNNLTYVTETFDLLNTGVLRILNCPTLYSTGDFNMSNSGLTGVDLPGLYSTSNLNMDGMASLVNVTLGGLYSTSNWTLNGSSVVDVAAASYTQMGGSFFDWSNTSSLIAIDLPTFGSCSGYLNISNSGALSISMPNLNEVLATGFDCYQCTATTSLAIGALINTSYINAQQCSSLTDVNIGLDPNCSLFNFAFCALNQITVDSILCDIDNSGAPTNDNGFVDFSGGSSASPSGTGSTCADDLSALHGWTITIN